MNELIVEEGFKRVAIVTHGGVIRYLLSKLVPEKRDFWEWKVPHGQGFELVYGQAMKHSGGVRDAICYGWCLQRKIQLGKSI